MNKQIAFPILTFFVLAFGLTFAFSLLPNIPLGNIDIKDILCGFGPLLSGLICYGIFKTPTTYTITGTPPAKSILIVLIAAATFLLTHTKGGLAVNLFFVVSQIIYCFGEEFGWRHYLQSATSGLNKWLQPLIIGVVWFCVAFFVAQRPADRNDCAKCYRAAAFCDRCCHYCARAFFGIIRGHYAQNTSCIIAYYFTFCYQN
jgi:membrane protease YdiL (CAAX protease family)